MAVDTSDVGLDEQDQAETFDETHLDEDAEFVTLEEMPKVFDVTSEPGDSREEPDGAGTAKPPAGRRPKHGPAELHRRQDELLDEGIEETFPASDPVSVKRIT